jgi:GxxExxY protein
MHHGHDLLDRRTEAMVTATIGCATIVHRSLGRGFLERAYERPLQLDLAAQRLRFDAQREVTVTISRHAADGPARRPYRWRLSAG